MRTLIYSPSGTLAVLSEKGLTVREVPKDLSKEVVQRLHEDLDVLDLICRRAIGLEVLEEARELLVQIGDPRAKAALVDKLQQELLRNEHHGRGSDLEVLGRDDDHGLLPMDDENVAESHRGGTR